MINKKTTSSLVLLSLVFGPLSPVFIAGALAEPLLTDSDRMRSPSSLSKEAQQAAQEANEALITNKNELANISLSDNDEDARGKEFDIHVSPITNDAGQTTGVLVEHNKNTIAVIQNNAEPVITSTPLKTSAGLPAVSLTIQQTPEEFSSFLSSFKKSGQGRLSAPEGRHFESLKRAFTELERGQKKALQNYIQNNTAPYRPPQSKTARVSSDEESSHAAASEEKSDNSAVQSSDDHRSEAGIHSSELTLSSISPKENQENLKRDLQKSYSRFQKKVSRLIPGKILVQEDGDTTEILIYLPAAQ